MSKYFSIFLVIFFVQSSLSQLVYHGQCPETKTLNEFDMDSYMGLWFGHAKMPKQVPELEGRKCVYDNYTYLGDNNLRLNGAGVFESSGIQTFTHWDGKVQGLGIFTVLYDEFQSMDIPNYYVLGTDYKHYTVIYNCENLNESEYTIDVWIFSRDRELASDYSETAKQILEKQGVDTSKLEYFKQDNCPEVVV